MRFPRFVLTLFVGIGLALFASQASAAPPCLAGQTGPATQQIPFLDPPDDEYCTFVDLTGCNASTLDVHWELFWSSVCTIPAKVYFRQANFLSAGCYEPGAVVGAETDLNLVGGVSQSIDHVATGVPNPGPGLFFVCIRVVDSGTCLDGTPILNPTLRLDASNETCQSYNITPAGTTALNGLNGNPVMWVESACVKGQTGPGTQQIAFLDPPNDEYCTFVDLTGCSGDPLLAHWELFWSSACTIPAEVVFRTAELGTQPDGNTPPCYTPGTKIGAPIAFDLVGTSGNIDHVSPPIANPGPGKFFVCITVKTPGTCTDGSPTMTNPALRLDAFNDACQSYNITPGGTAELNGFNGNPVMWVEPQATPANSPPDCDDAVASPARLEKHDGKYQAINILGVTDPDGDDVTITITGVSQDEPVSGKHGAGHTCPDAKFAGDQVSVRAERSGKKPKDGRIYEISFTASDGKGGTCTGKVRVCVPDKKKISKKDTPDCVDSGQQYDSQGPCLKGDHDHRLLAEDVLDLVIGEVTSSAAEISFSVPTTGHVEVAVFDLLGRRLSTLENSVLSGGIHDTTWKMDGVRNGLYFVRITMGEEKVTRRVVRFQ